MAKKTHNAWCIWRLDIGPVLETVARTRTDAIEKFCTPSYRLVDIEWQRFRRDGYRCVRVVITAIEKGGG